MEFSVDDGVRLVRSLTDKVRSAMSNFLINPDTDRSSVRWNEDEHLLTLGDDKDLESSLLQIQDVQQPSRNEPSISHESEKQLSNYIDHLVKHKNKLSSANLIKSDTVDNKILEHFAQRDIDRKDVSIQRAKPNNDRIINSTRTVHSKPFKSVATFTNDDLKQLGLDYIKKDELLPLDKIADVPSDGQNHRVYTEDIPNVTNNPSCIRTTNRKNFFNVKTKDIVPSDTNTKGSCRCSSFDTETDEALKEFEKDILYLSGCKNKTSTPEKRALSTKPHHNKSPDFKHPKISPKRTQCRRFLRPRSPLVESSTESNLNLCLAKRTFQKLFSLRKHTDDCIANEQRIQTHSSSDTVDGLLNISPASERWMTTAGLAHSRQTRARRSLFSEQPGFGNNLPLTSLLTNKPLGYEAYQQFMSVSKSDVLPKYFFENEDEEAVYYLKVKYLDDRK